MAQPLTNLANQAVKNTTPGLQYNDQVKAEGGVSINPQTQAQTTAPVMNGAPLATIPNQKDFNIPVQDITPAVQMNLPQPQVSMDDANALVANVKAGQKSVDQYIKDLTPAETATQTEQTGIMGRIKSLIPGLTGRGDAQLKAEATQKVDLQKKRLAQLNGEATQLAAEFDALVASQSGTGTGITTQDVIGQQGATLRAKAATLGVKQAQILATQGNLQAAQDTANRSVDLMYQDKEAALNAQYKQLELIQPLLSKEEKTQALAQTEYINSERDRIAETKADQKANLDLAFTTNTTTKFANKGGKMFRVSDGYAYNNVQEFFKDAGVSSFEEAYQKGIITDISAETVANRDYVMKLRETYPDAGIDFLDDPQTATDKLGQSNKYLRENAQDTTPKIVDINGVSSVFNPDTGTFDPIYSDGAANGTTDGLNKYISNSGGNLKLGVGQVDTLSGFDGAISQSDTALQMLDSGVQTGPVAAFNLSVNKKLNTADPKSMQLEQALAQLKADFQKAVSGATVSDQEVQRLSAFLPTFSDQESVIKSKLQNLKTNLGTKKSVFLETLGGQENPNYGSGGDINYSNTPVNIGKNTAGLTFNSAGNASASNQVKGMSQKAQPMQTIGDFSPVRTPLMSVVQKKLPAGATGGQCGDYARKLVTSTGFTYPPLGNGLNDKVAAVQRYGVPAVKAQIGSVVVTRENPTYGHVAVVIGKNQQGVLVSESNFKQSNKVSNGRLIPYSKIVGAINPHKA